METTANVQVQKSADERMQTAVTSVLAFTAGQDCGLFRRPDGHSPGHCSSGTEMVPAVREGQRGKELAPPSVWSVLVLRYGVSPLIGGWVMDQSERRCWCRRRRMRRRRRPGPVVSGVWYWQHGGES